MKTIKGTKVSFEEDSLVALYIGEDLVHEGWVSDGIHDQIDGWVACLEHQGNKVKIDHIYVVIDDQYPDDAPKTLKEVLATFKTPE